MTGLSLFTGVGIGEVVFRQIFPDYKTIGYVEIDKYCRSIIRARIRDGVLDDAPIFDDIREFNARYAGLYAGKVDFISGGFPCQPFSVAGRQLGQNDERNLWPETSDCISIVRPQHIFLENVPGIADYRYRITSDLSGLGYGAEWDIVPAAFVGAPHLRLRWWLVANAKRSGLEGQPRHETKRGQGRKGPARSVPSSDSGAFWSDPLAAVIRMDDGVAYRVDRIRAIGNGWVPQVVAKILEVK